MFPKEKVNLNILNKKVLSNKKQNKTFLFDFKKGDFVLEDGKLIEIEDLEALKMWIEKVLRTEKFKFKIYEKKNREQEYGITLQDLIIGGNLPLEIIESEIKREISEALLKHPMISKLDNWKIERNNPSLKVSVKVITKDERIFDKEVVF